MIESAVIKYAGLRKNPSESLFHINFQKKKKKKKKKEEIFFNFLWPMLLFYNSLD